MNANTIVRPLAGFRRGAGAALMKRTEMTQG